MWKFHPIIFYLCPDKCAVTFAPLQGWLLTVRQYIQSFVRTLSANQTIIIRLLKEGKRCPSIVKIIIGVWGLNAFSLKKKKMRKYLQKTRKMHLNWFFFFVAFTTQFIFTMILIRSHHLIRPSAICIYEWYKRPSRTTTTWFSDEIKGCVFHQNGSLLCQSYRLPK